MTTNHGPSADLTDYAKCAACGAQTSIPRDAQAFAYCADCTASGQAEHVSRWIDRAGDVFTSRSMDTEN